MGADLRFPIAQNPCTCRAEPVPNLQDIIDFVADVVDAARRIFGEKSLNGGTFAQGAEQLDFRVGQINENNRHAMVGFFPGGTDIGTQGSAVLVCRRVQIRHGYGDVIQATDHGNPCAASVFIGPVCRPGADLATRQIERTGHVGAMRASHAKDNSPRHTGDTSAIWI